MLSYAEYQRKIRSIRTPEDAKAFAEELIAPAEAVEEKPPVAVAIEPKRPEPIQVEAPRREKDVDVASTPWYDIAGNDNEAMVITLYAKGLTTRDISSYMKLHHGADISQPGISAITDKVFPLVKEWQSRPLSSCYPVVYMDGLHFKVREAGKISSKVAYIALGINQYGYREILGIWISESEGSKFWLHVMNDMKNRGVEDVIFACIDGLRGFPEAVKAVFPETDVQVCIVHQIRHTIMFIPFKDREEFCADLKEVYTAPSEEAGMQALKDMMSRWPRYAMYLKSWEQKWHDLAPFFSFPEAIRRIIYTTNTIENLNRQFRKVTKTTTVFPHDDALLKLLWLAQADITQNWTLATRNWAEVMAQLSILYPDRIRI
ncbi:MAG TPA: IS256 family transposase [Candidatus Paceibacterota bacterium]|nr:IS256 family transposase [Candidatus Paceibacterota bacterium]